MKVKAPRKVPLPMTEKPITSVHFNDWPNTQGFDSHYEEREPVELKVEGHIPSYAVGVLFRTGLGPRSVKTDNGATFQVNHWFDNFAQVHRFQIHPPQAGKLCRVTYNSRLVSDGLIEKVKKTGKLDTYTFAQRYDPCKSVFQKLQAVFQSTSPPNAPDEVNVGVTMSANFPGLDKTGQPMPGAVAKNTITTLCNKTDGAFVQMLNPETLEPIGMARQTALHPDLKGPGSGAHAKSDPLTGDVYNYNLEFGRVGTYRIFRASASTGKTSILASLYHTPAYLHSLFLSENYVILCVWNSFYSLGGVSILYNRNLLDSISWDGNRPATWFVIDKRTPEEGGRGLVATYESDPFMCFHTINAYEKPSSSDPGKIDVIADLDTYANTDVLHRFYFENLVSDSPSAAKWSDSSNDRIRPTYRRYRLSSVPSATSTTPTKSNTKPYPKAILEYESPRTSTPELPTINPAHVTKKHRYIYGINDSGKSTFADSLVKFDTQTNEVLRWSKHGHTAGEAVFIADPDRKNEEDGGVLLAVVLDGFAGKSYLLVLDAKDLSEIGRAHVDGVVGMAFHGLFVKEGKKVDGENGLHL